MIEDLLNKRENFRLQIRRKDIDYKLKIQRQEMIVKLQALAMVDNVPQGQFKQLGIQLMQSIVQLFTDRMMIMFGAWQFVLELFLKFVKNCYKLLNPNNSMYIIEMGLTCCILILSQKSQYIAMMKNRKTLPKFYYGDQTLQTLVTKLILGYLSVTDINFHRNIVSEEYFQVLDNILQNSNQRTILVELFIQLFCSNEDFQELYFPIFESFINLTHGYPSTGMFILWKIIILSSQVCIVDWLLQRGFVQASVDVLKQPGMDGQRVLLVLECIDVMLRSSEKRMICDENILSPEVQFKNQGIIDALIKLSSNFDVYTEAAQKMLQQFQYCNEKQ